MKITLDTALIVAQLLTYLVAFPYGVFKIWRKLDMRLAEQDNRLIRIESQFHRNGGSSLRDAVDRMDRDLAKLTGRFDQHLVEKND
jgi:hypothetical protein